MNLDQLKIEAGKAALEKLVQARADYRKPREKVVELLKSDRSEEAKTVLLLELRPKQVAYMDRLEDLVKLQDALMTQSGAEVSASVAKTRLSVASLLALAFVLAFGMALWIIRSITRPIDEAVAISRWSFAPTAAPRPACCWARCTR